MPVWNKGDNGEEVRNSLKQQGQQNLKNSEHRRMELQSDLLTFQRDQRLSRAVRLQWEWQELSERERRAQHHNKQLLQEFERAQDTLRDMVARTAAMNTIRVEFEKYLDDHLPRWQQELKEKTLSAQKKRLEQHLKESTRRMEEENVTRSSIPQTPLSQAKVHQPQNGQQDYNSHPTSISHSFQSSWLTNASSQLVDPQTRLPFRPEKAQVSHPNPQSFPPPPPFHPFHLPQTHPFQYPHPSSIPIQPQTVAQQDSQMWVTHDHPLAWAGGGAGFPFRAPFGHQCWTGSSMLNPQGGGGGQGVVEEDDGRERSTATRPEGQSSDGLKQRSSDQSHELDIKPVRLSSGHGESSECSRPSSLASAETDNRAGRKRREQKDGRAKPSSVNHKETYQSSGGSVCVEASVSPASGVHSSEGENETSEGGSMRSRRSVGLSVKQPKSNGGRTRSKRVESGSQVEGSESQIEESQSPVQRSVNPREESKSHEEESGSHREESMSPRKESGSVSVQTVGCEEEVQESEGEQESLGGEGGTTGKEDVMDEKHGEDEEMGEEDGGKEELDEESLRDNEGISLKRDKDDEEEDNEKGEELDEEAREEEAEEKQGGMTEDFSQRQLEEKGGVGVENEREEDEEGSAGDEAGEEEEGSNLEAEEESEAIDQEEERESDNSIISPKEHRPKDSRPSLAQEEEEEEGEEEEAVIGGDEDNNEGCDNYDEDDGPETGCSSSADPSCAFEDEDDDIENLLAPQVGTQTKQGKQKITTESVPKATGEGLNSLSEEEGLEEKTKAIPVAQNTDSDDEFDHFYD